MYVLLQKFRKTRHSVKQIAFICFSTHTTQIDLSIFLRWDLAIFASAILLREFSSLLAQWIKASAEVIQK